MLDLPARLNVCLGLFLAYATGFPTVAQARTGLRLADEPSAYDRTMSAWLERLKNDPLPRIRRAAVVALVEIALKHPTTRPTLLPVLGRTARQDAAAIVRQQAILATWRLPIEAQLLLWDDWVAGLKTEAQAEVQSAFLQGLTRLGPQVPEAEVKRAVPLVESFLGKDDEAVVLAAADCLGHWGAPATSARGGLMAVTRSESPARRRAAARALGRIQPEQPAEVAQRILEVIDQEPESTELPGLLTALGLLGRQPGARSPAVSEALATRLQVTEKQSREMQLSLLETIAKIGTDRPMVRSALLSCLQPEQDPALRRQAVRTLGQLLESDAASLCELLERPLRQDAAYEVRLAAVEQLARLAPNLEPRRRLLTATLTDPHAQVREAAHRALASRPKTEVPEAPVAP